MGQSLSKPDLELYRRIDEILHFIWDPIGVADVPEARSEYHSYLPQVFSLVRKNSSSEEIASYLGGIQSGPMGMPVDKKKNLEIAEILLRLKDSLNS